MNATACNTILTFGIRNPSRLSVINLHFLAVVGCHGSPPTTLVNYLTAAVFLLVAAAFQVTTPVYTGVNPHYYQVLSYLDV